MSVINSKNSLGKKLQEDFCNFCDEAAAIFKRFPFLREPEQALLELQQSIRHPFNLAVFGRMKTGKSTLINALIGENLAITGVEEATATINVISYADSAEQLGQFTVHWKDSPAQTYPLTELQEKWTGKTTEVLENVRNTSYIELYSALEFLKLCEITDTPGTGSEVAEHEEVTQSFLDATSRQGRRADAIIYVFPPVGRESDLENLETFRANNCLPDSDPYNSIAVLHKWDHIYWENGGNITDIRNKAQRVYNAMSVLVADVIPVSAPMALAAAKAPDDFFVRIKELCQTTSWEELQRLLSRDTKWNRDENREKLFNMYRLPWATFQNIIREVALHPDKCIDLSGIRQHIRQLSGIDQLLLFLDRNFFTHSEIIRQKQKYAEIYRIKQQAYSLIQQHLEILDSDIEAWEVLFNKDFPESNVVTWLSRKREDAWKEKKELLQSYELLDSTFLNSSIPLLIQDSETVHWCEKMSSQGKFFSSTQFDDLKKIFSYLSGDQTVFTSENLDTIEELHIYAAQLANHPIRAIRDHASHIRLRIEMLLQLLQQ